MKTPPSTKTGRLAAAWRLVQNNLQPLRLPWRLLLLITLLSWTPLLHAQIIGVRDVFNYTVANLNGHAPTTGTGTWAVWTSGTNCAISTSGSQCDIKENGGTPGSGNATANIGFTANTNTLYTITTTLKFTGLTGTADCWAGVGYNDGNSAAPWILIRPQSTGTSNTPGTGLCVNGNWTNGNVPASFYSAPMVVTLVWNTNTGLIQYFINNTLFGSGTYSLVAGKSYSSFFQGFQTGNAVSVVNTTVAAQTLSMSTIAMQDNFTYSGTSINNCTPTTVMGSGWSAKWSLWSSNGVISTTGTQALVTANGGTPGAGSVVASFPFEVSPNMFYTLRAAIQFTGLTGTADCWAGFGFSVASGPNVAPWMLIRPQSTGTSVNPGAGLDVNNGNWYTGTIPAAYYSAPIPVTITWNSSTGVAKCYINDLLQWTGTSTTMPNGQYNAFFQGFQTGNAVSVNTISLTAQPLPLTEIWYAPQYDGRPGYNDFPNNFNAILETGTTPCGWPTARSHVNVFNVYDSAFYRDLSAAQQISLVQYLIKNNIQLGICINPLTSSTSQPCRQGEAYDNPANHQTAVRSLQTAITAATNGSNNWSPAYVSLDSPGYGFESGTCISLADSATQTAASIATFKAAWPGMKVVEYDSLSHFPQADVTAWFTAMRQAGQPIDAVADDFNWYISPPSELSGTGGLAATCAASGVAYGLIYDGFCGVPYGDGGSDPNLAAQYALGMKINMQTFNASQSPLPVKAVVATWGTPNTVTVPETTPTNLTALCNLALTSPYVLQAPPVALYTVWNASVWSRYTSSYAQYQAWISGTGGYYTASILGAVAQTQNPSSGIFGLVPIYQYSNTGMSPNQYALSLSASDSDLISYGYSMLGTLGYVFPASNGAALGGVPLYGAHKYVGPVNQYIYQNTPFVGLDDTFNPNNDYRKRLNGGNPLGYMLPGFYHNGYGSYGPY